MGIFMFFFEGMNGVLLKHIHGTQYAGLQCVRTFSVLQGFPPPEDMLSILNETDFVKKLACSLTKRIPKPQPLGKKKPELSKEEEKLLQDRGLIYECYFNRVWINGTVFHGLLWKASQRRHNCAVKFKTLILPPVLVVMDKSKNSFNMTNLGYQP